MSRTGVRSSMERCRPQESERRLRYRRAQPPSARKLRVRDFGSIRLFLPRAGRAAGLAAEPTREIIWVVEAALRRGFGHRRGGAQRSLRGFQARAITQSAEAE